MKYVIYITPEPALRPSPARRGDKLTMINKPKYTAYKNTLSLLCRGKTVVYKGKTIKGIKIPQGNYYRIDVDFYMPYPKSTPKYKRIDKKPYRKKPDWDNCFKALQDALEQAKVIKGKGEDGTTRTNDSLISGGRGDQWYTTEETGRIEFKLELYEEVD